MEAKTIYLGFAACLTLWVIQRAWREASVWFGLGAALARYLRSTNSKRLIAPDIEMWQLTNECNQCPYLIIAHP